MITDYHANYYAHELCRVGGTGVDRIGRALFDAHVDLNPHQIEAALFALRSPLSKGALLADEVGLGKTIEAGLVLCQYWAERRRNILVITPASIRKQWALELSEKFNLPSIVLDAKIYKDQQKMGFASPFRDKKIIICSMHFAANHAEDLKEIAWDLVVIDEAHKLRNAYRESNRLGQRIRWATEDSKKLLLTATPLQNSLLELYGLSTLIDDRLFGDLASFRTQYINYGGDISSLRDRLGAFCWRTLRNQVMEFVRYTERKLITRPFKPTEMEHNLYEVVSSYLKRDETYALPSGQKRLQASDGMAPVDVWHHKATGTTDDGGKDLKALFGNSVFDNPKPASLIQRAATLSPSGAQSVMDHFAGSGTIGHAVINLNRDDGGTRKYILVEMGDYFDTVLKPRIAKVVYSENWQDGKPTARNTGISHCFRTIRLESYEDTLNNLRLDHNPQRKKALDANPSLKEDYMLRYLLDVETRGSRSLLNIDAFTDPTAYTLDVKKPGTDEYVTRAVDLIETFNYLIGLRVLHTSVPQTFQASFMPIMDPELPEDQQTRLVVDGRIHQDAKGMWWFRKVEGWVPKNPANPNNGQREKVLIVWRKLTSDIEQDNLMLDEWFQKNRINTRDFEFDTIYVNGSNNLPNLKLDNENWKVRLIEEEFMKRMWDLEGMA